MSYNEFIELYPYVDLIMELFKGIAPSLIAILAIVINNKKIDEREKKKQEQEKKKKMNEALILGLYEMLDKYRNLSKCFYECSDCLVYYIIYFDKSQNKKNEDDFTRCIHEVSSKILDTHDYCEIMYQQYNWNINDDILFKELEIYTDKILQMSESFTELFDSFDEKQRLNKIKDIQNEVTGINERIRSIVYDITSEICVEIRFLREC